MFAAFWQAPLLQRPVFPQVVVTGQPPCGSGMPFCTAVQVPTPLTLQAWQVGQLAVVQQTPSVQLFVPHSWLEVQASPGAFLARQLPLLVAVQ